jgi:hypothetical protein
MLTCSQFYALGSEIRYQYLELKETVEGQDDPLFALSNCSSILNLVRSIVFRGASYIPNISSGRLKSVAFINVDLLPFPVRHLPWTTISHIHLEECSCVETLLLALRGRPLECLSLSECTLAVNVVPDDKLVVAHLAVYADAAQFHTGRFRDLIHWDSLVSLSVGGIDVEPDVELTSLKSLHISFDTCE